MTHCAKTHEMSLELDFSEALRDLEHVDPVGTHEEVGKADEDELDLAHFGKRQRFNVSPHESLSAHMLSLSRGASVLYPSCKSMA